VLRDNLRQEQISRPDDFAQAVRAKQRASFCGRIIDSILFLHIFVTFKAMRIHSFKKFYEE
jgi:hypothetical protein